MVKGKNKENPEEEKPGEENPEEENLGEEKPISEHVDEAEQIRDLLDKGYSPKQLRDEFDFNRETVRLEIKKRVPPENKDERGEELLPATLKKTEVITPEGIMQEYLVEDGVEGRAMLRGMMMLRAAQRMVMDDVEIMKGQAEADAAKLRPILKLMEETRKEQDAAAERAKASGEEIAERAATGVAEAISPAFEGLRSAITASGSNPMMGMMTDIMGPYLKNMMSQFMPGGGGEQPTTPKGFVRKGGQEE